MPAFNATDLERYLNATSSSLNTLNASGQYENVFEDDAEYQWPPASVEGWFDGSERGEQTTVEWLTSRIGPQSVNEGLLDLLTSPASDDVVSERLVDLLGFEHLETIPDILKKRSSLRMEDELDAKAATNGNPPLTNGTQTSSNLPIPSSNAYQPGRRAQIVFQTEEEIKEAKHHRHQARKMAATIQDKHNQTQLSLQEMHEIRQRSLQDAALRDGLPVKRAEDEAEIYPHVYTSNNSGRNLTAWGERFSLPVGTTHDHFDKYEEITIPAATQAPASAKHKLINISDLDELARGSFPGYKTLNRLQSLVFEVAYKTNENMLVCAPTGAGKTDVAVLTLLRTISQHAQLVHQGASTALSSKDFKIVYVAPMKALAAEVVRKMTKRLSWLGIQVRELTGDMQLTRSEIAKTQMIVTTPEKWAVVTNKPSAEGDLASQVKLLIIDEVHLLHDDRGAVIETLVARTLRQVESSQGLIRIVGLSATLPNYVDVADFLGVNRYQGLFYFDSSFRPVPLEQHFIGVKGKAGSATSRNNLEEATFDKVSQLVKDGHQVMVFVHARKETVKTAQTLHEKASAENIADLFDPSEHPRYQYFKREMSTSRNREMRELFNYGFGIHHAGMLRSDRNISERLFEAGLTKVLVCTATLAWGVNLPAYAVVIKGTQVYDSGKGAFSDLSILDVLQIFGRAGRPQYENQGVGYICTSADKVNDYVAAIMHQIPIESKFVKGILDALNAEIVLGTVRTIDEGVRWIGYTFLYVRMRKNPMVYGMSQNEVVEDPSLGQKRYQLMNAAAKQLAAFKMINFDPDSGSLSATQIGVIAAKYYLKSASIELFNEIYKPKITEADALHVLSKSCEFEQIVVRDNELTELSGLLERVPCEIKDGIQAPPGKVNALLQAYISRCQISDFALISDSAYVAQNAGRISRSLFEIALSNEWPSAARVYLAICKAIEHRMWPFDHPLTQCNLKPELMYMVESDADDWTVQELAHSEPDALAKALRTDERLAKVVREAARTVPRFRTTAKVQTLSSDLLRVNIRAKVDFTWNERLHHTALQFWILLTDEDQDRLVQHAFVTVTQATSVLQHSFTFTFDILPKQLTVEVISNSWLTDDEPVILSLHDVILPGSTTVTHQSAVDVPFESLRHSIADLKLDFRSVDAFSVQFLHSLLHTRANVCINSPSPRHRDLALQCALRHDEDDKAGVAILTASTNHANLLYQSLQREYRPCKLASSSQDLQDWQSTTSASSEVLIVSTSLLYDNSVSTITKLVDQTHLIVATETHVIDERYEIALTFIREQLQKKANARIIATGDAVQNNQGLARWLGCNLHHTFSFGPTQISDNAETLITTFPMANSRQVLQSMIRPAFSILREQGNSVGCCVCTSRAQAFQTAALLTKQLAGQLADSEVFIGDRELLSVASQQVEFSEVPAVSEALVHGIVIMFNGMKSGTKALLGGLLRARAARVLITTKDDTTTSLMTLAGAPFADVILLGTRYMATPALHPSRASREVKRQDESRRDDFTAKFIEYDLHLVMRLQALAASRFHIMCHAEQSHLYSRVMREGFFLESKLLETNEVHDSVTRNEQGLALLDRLLLERICQRAESSRQHLMSLVSHTFLAQQLNINPSFYSKGPQDMSAFLSQTIDERLLYLGKLCLITIKKDDKITASALGQQWIRHSELKLGLLEDLQQAKIDDLRKMCKDIDVSKYVLTDEALSDYVSPFLLLFEPCNVHLLTDRYIQHARLPRKLKTDLNIKADQMQAHATLVLFAGFVMSRSLPANSDMSQAQADVILHFCQNT